MPIDKFNFNMYSARPPWVDEVHPPQSHVILWETMTEALKKNGTSIHPNVLWEEILQRSI